MQESERKPAFKADPIPVLAVYQVYRGRRKCTGQIAALKFISKHGKSEKDKVGLRKEIHILRKLRHENIILWLDAFETQDAFVVVTELAQGEQLLRFPHAGGSASLLPSFKAFGARWAGDATWSWICALSKFTEL